MIKLSDYPDYAEGLEAEAYSYGLEIESMDESPCVLYAKKDKEMYPIIYLFPEEEGTSIYLTPVLSFPKQLDASDLEFYDSVEHVMGEYLKIGKFCTWLAKNPIQLDLMD